MSDIDYCKECKTPGKCCELGYVREGKKYWFNPPIKCPFLDDKGRCMTYETRFENAPWCTTMEDLAEHNGVPKECGYKEVLDFKLEDAGIVEITKEQEEKIYEQIKPIWEGNKPEEGITVHAPNFKKAEEDRRMGEEEEEVDEE